MSETTSMVAQANQISKEEIKEIVQSFILGNKLSRELTSTEKDICIRTAQEFRLNPLKREIHFIKRGQDLTITVGYEVYLKRAENSGKLNGWKVDLQGEGSNLEAVVTIYRKDWAYPFIHNVYFLEAKQSTPIWLKMPRFMLKKVAIGQAFRLAFPEEMGGLPYMSEEIGMEGHIEQPQEVQEKTQEPVVDIPSTQAPQKPTCEDCGAEVSEGIKKYSLDRYSRVLCMKDQKTWLDSEQKEARESQQRMIESEEEI